MVSSAEKKRVGTLIKKRRQELGIRTQADLAARTGTSETSVAKWESGKHYPARFLGKLEAVLGISLTEDEQDPVVAEIRELAAVIGADPSDWIALRKRARTPPQPPARTPPQERAG